MKRPSLCSPNVVVWHRLLSHQPSLSFAASHGTIRVLYAFNTGYCNCRNRHSTSLADRNTTVLVGQDNRPLTPGCG